MRRYFCDGCGKEVYKGKNEFKTFYKDIGTYDIRTEDDRGHYCRECFEENYPGYWDQTAE
jgi:hypothetical protein